MKDIREDKQFTEFYPSMGLYGFTIVLRREINPDDDTIETTINYIMAKDLLSNLFKGIVPLSKEAEKQIKILKESKKKIDSISKEAMDNMIEQAKKLLKEEE